MAVERAAALRPRGAGRRSPRMVPRVHITVRVPASIDTSVPRATAALLDGRASALAYGAPHPGPTRCVTPCPRFPGSPPPRHRPTAPRRRTVTAWRGGGAVRASGTRSRPPWGASVRRPRSSRARPGRALPPSPRWRSASPAGSRGSASGVATSSPSSSRTGRRPSSRCWPSRGSAPWRTPCCRSTAVGSSASSSARAAHGCSSSRAAIATATIARSSATFAPSCRRWSMSSSSATAPWPASTNTAPSRGASRPPIGHRRMPMRSRSSSTPQARRPTP